MDDRLMIDVHQRFVNVYVLHTCWSCILMIGTRLSFKNIHKKLFFMKICWCMYV